MTDFPENEAVENTSDQQNNTEENTVDTETYEPQDDFSTVFSDPSVHKKSAQNFKKRKKLPVVIACVLAVAVLVGGIFALKKFVPVLEDEEKGGTEINDIEVLNIDTSELKTVTITNSNGEFKFISEKVYKTTENGDSSDTSSESDEPTVVWYQDGLDRELVSSDVIGSAISTLSNISASREVTEKTASDCGFDNPQGKVVYEKENGEVSSYTVGAQSPDKSGYYIEILETGKIYVVNDTFKTLIEFKQLDVANTATMKAFPVDKIPSEYVGEDGMLSTFDTVTITGKEFSVPYVFIPNSDEKTSNFAAYKLKSPMVRSAEKIEEILTAFKTGVMPDAAYSMDTSAASLKAVGLDNPDFTVKLEAGGESLTYKFKIQDDTSAAVICDGCRLVQRVPISTVAFIKYKPTNFYSAWIALNSIDNVKNLTVKTPEKDYSFDIEKVDDEDAEEKYIINYNGKKLDTSSFQNFYQVCVGLTAADYVINEQVEATSYSFVYTFKDDIGGKNVIEFQKDGASRYRYSSDGIPMGRINSSAMNKVVSELQKLVG